ncbi:MAG: hypothetical protein R2741_10445 [Methanolobus sp.]
MNEDGSSDRQLSNLSGALSPDGSKIAYVNGSELISTNLDGSNKQVIYTIPTRTGMDGLLAWSPDSAKLVFSERDDEDIDLANLKIINSDGTNLIDIGVASIFYLGPGIQSLQSQAWSPDGSKLVYVSYFFQGNGGFVSTANSDGTNQKGLVGEISEDASFSPDGSKIVYVYNNLNYDDWGVCSIWMMNADGSNKTQLTTASGYRSNPVWSPDGTKIAFVSRNSDDSDIWVINLKEVSGNNNVITVDDDGVSDYTTIQDAINAAKVGDIILVSPGTYNENVNVYKSVTVESTEGADVTHVVGTSEYPVFYVTAYESTTIKGFNIINDNGIMIV